MLNFEKTYQGWSAERIGRHVLYWLAWLLFYATVNSSYHDDSFITWVNVELIIMVIKLPFTYFVIYFLVPNYLIKKQYVSFFLWIILLASIGGIGVRALDYYIIAPYLFGLTPGSFFYFKIFYKILDLIYVAALPVVLKLFQRYVQEEKKSQQISEQKLNAELQLLKNQLHPHFLFNTLNNLYALVLTNDKNAPDVVLRLSNMMNYMLYECDKDLIALDKEIINLKNYIELEKIRYEDRLDISFETGGDIAHKSIAPLLLISFLENAFKHGPGNNEKPSWIRINLWVENDQLDFLIENSINNEDTDIGNQQKMQSGIGLSNVKKRLELVYPNRYTLKIAQNDTFFVQLKLEL